MTDIALDRDEIERLRGFNRSRDFPGGYAYISSIIGRHPEFDRDTAFWFEKARQVNMDVRSDPADIYIRSATACGLRWDNRMGDSRAVNAPILQKTSDGIASAVLTQVINSRKITTANVFISQDIVGALANGQTVGGWGGAFYYWNAPFVPQGMPPGMPVTFTVGSYILSHPDEREKFVACNAAASLDAVQLTALPGLPLSTTIPGRLDSIVLARIDLLMNGLATSRQAQAPDFIKAEIRTRAIAMALGRPAAGDPDRIGDYAFDGSTWSIPEPAGDFGVALPAAERDPTVVAQLDARRRVRQAHRGFQPVSAY